MSSKFIPYDNQAAGRDRPLLRGVAAGPLLLALSVASPGIAQPTGAAGNGSTGAMPTISAGGTDVGGGHSALDLHGTARGGDISGGAPATWKLPIIAGTRSGDIAVDSGTINGGGAPASITWTPNEMSHSSGAAAGGSGTGVGGGAPAQVSGPGTSGGSPAQVDDPSMHIGPGEGGG